MKYQIASYATVTIAALGLLGCIVQAEPRRPREVVVERPVYVTPPGPPVVVAPPPTVVVVPERGGPPPWVPANGYREKHAYQYYYREQVYYNIDNHSWCWLEGRNWRVGMELPRRIRLSADRVTVELDGLRPDVYHPQVITVYPPTYRVEVRPGPPGRGPVR
jgi:hypothetical protein